ncbi:VRR-NUC domain-containing protein [Halomonas campisalis]|uniref:phosphodiesterase I n=1 Tax=Billgrantia campisalis TaxID=74661 RepID=A0ABS9PD55_9GAMM|nr:VRR-NUC domain-containing protein [Halomonas campisalis]MCG6659695.1 VRR-NUC domain-containing protein [Halomonas campisalis]MDR5864671.1 VRR-NUC domain-containing protein [Halomonas campisalis]
MNSVPAGAFATASLEDPFYYLTNFAFVLGWVAERHGDLLDDAERRFLTTFEALPRAAQALLVRMVMRKGEHFRTSRLVYPEISAEIGATSAALAPLVEAGFVEPDPELSFDELCRQLRLAELRRVFAAELAAAGLGRATKTALREALAPRFPDARRLAAWWPGAPEGERIVRLTVMATCDRLRLMFFGNLRQDWAEFVLAELGVQRFERVAFTADSRAFQRRCEVDAYLALHRLGERLEAGESPSALNDALPAVPEDNAWLVARRQRLGVALGRQAERAGEVELALTLYREAGWPVAAGGAAARIRRLRLLERQGAHAEAHALAEALAETGPGEAEAQALARLRPRLRRRLGLTPLPREAESAPERFELCLPVSPGVERAVCEHLHRDEAPVAYVENALFTGLFGLLCWEALFAPLPGAFFHPFHTGPADLYREDFVARRRERFAACLARLDDGRYREAIRGTWRAKHGIASPFVHWERLDEPLLDQALACLPAEHLRACCERLLADLKANRAGLPDLIQFLPEAAPGEPRYRLIEVKGPGDRLQDNQRRWLAFFHAQGMPAAVCHVRWRTPPGTADG